MSIRLLEARKNILFVEDPRDFLKNCSAFTADIKRQMAEEPEKKAELLAVAADICIDLKSFLTQWVLGKYIREQTLSEADIDNGFHKILSFVEACGADELAARIWEETKAIEKSNIKKMCDLELAGRLFTYWGHDYCTGLTHSLRRGARFVTSNPAKINLYRKENPQAWDAFVRGIRGEHPGIETEEMISRLFVKVAAISARELMPIHEATNGEFGFVCVQVNPKNWQDAAKMAEEIEFWNGAFKEELGMSAPNIVYKIPAVNAGVDTVKRIVQEGLRVCLTLNFTCSQHRMFADLIEEGSARGFVVLMSGFLDDAVEKELAGLGIEPPKTYSRHAGEAVIRRSFASLWAEGCKRTSILSAAIRGEWTIKNSISPYPDAPMYFTTMTEKIQEFDSEPRSLDPIVNDAVPEEALRVLEKSSIFRQAYHPELLTPENLDDYIPLQTVLGNFIKAYCEIEESLK